MAEEANTSALRITLACIVCGKEFTFTKATRGRHPRFCSSECKDQRHLQIGRESRARLAHGVRRNRYPLGTKRSARPKYQFTCESCGKTYAAVRVRQGNRFCSSQCQNDWYGAKAKAVTQSRLVRLVCPVCGRDFKQHNGEQAYCSVRCRKRLGNTKKNHLRRGAPVVENVDPFRVFDRDRWTCQLCGARTPRRLRGTTDAKAPELDHIVPLSRGGEHSYRNTQCACRSCNMRKGSRIIGQMRLF